MSDYLCRPESSLSEGFNGKKGRRVSHFFRMVEQSRFFMFMEIIIFSSFMGS
jgi:hypothetical protein